MNNMEREIGEKFSFNGTTLEVVEAKQYDCLGCFFHGKRINFCKKMKCTPFERVDHKNIYFKEVNK